MYPILITPKATDFTTLESTSGTVIFQLFLGSSCYRKLIFIQKQSASLTDYGHYMVQNTPYHTDTHIHIHTHKPKYGFLKQYLLCIRTYIIVYYSISFLRMW